MRATARHRHLCVAERSRGSPAAGGHRVPSPGQVPPCPFWPLALRRRTDWSKTDSRQASGSWRRNPPFPRTGECVAKEPPRVTTYQKKPTTRGGARVGAESASASTRKQDVGAVAFLKRWLRPAQTLAGIAPDLCAVGDGGATAGPQPAPPPLVVSMGGRDRGGVDVDALHGDQRRRPGRSRCWRRPQPAGRGRPPAPAGLLSPRQSMLGNRGQPLVAQARQTPEFFEVNDQWVSAPIFTQRVDPHFVPVHANS